MASKYGHDSRPTLLGKIGSRDARIAELEAEVADLRKRAKTQGTLFRSTVAWGETMEAERDAITRMHYRKLGPKSHVVVCQRLGHPPQTFETEVEAINYIRKAAGLTADSEATTSG